MTLSSLVSASFVHDRAYKNSGIQAQVQQKMTAASGLAAESYSLYAILKLWITTLCILVMTSRQK